MDLIKFYTNHISNERMYYMEKKLSPHDILLFDFYANLVYNNCQIVEFVKEPRWLNGKYRSDGFFVFKFNDVLRACFVEVDLSHTTNFPKYQEIFESNELQEKYGGYPMLVVVGDVEQEYRNDNFDTIYLDFKMNNFAEKVLAV